MTGRNDRGLWPLQTANRGLDLSRLAGFLPVRRKGVVGISAANIRGPVAGRQRALDICLGAGWTNSCDRGGARLPLSAWASDAVGAVD